ncbi:MAG: prepilin-type N-terminal cleavage/methylation domain-containing protein [Chloroflexota bacterium]|nr:prepilin-type N-terminal cleavage/methylation domain-containing protein [Chloroflexota bacterium]
MRTRKEDGFTLLEVLVAMAILSIGLLGLLGMTIHAMHSNAYSEDYIIANNLIIERAEDLRRTGFSNLTIGGPPTPGYSDSTTHPKTPGLTFNREWTIAADPYVPDLLMTVTITVTWQRNADSTQRQITSTFSVGGGV